MSAPNKCPRCGTQTIAIRNKHGGSFQGCPNFAKGCRPGTGPFKDGFFADKGQTLKEVIEPKLGQQNGQNKFKDALDKWGQEFSGDLDTPQDAPEIPDTVETKLGGELYKQIKPFVQAEVFDQSNRVRSETAKAIKDLGAGISAQLHDIDADMSTVFKDFEKRLAEVRKIAQENNSTPKFVEWRVNDVPIAKIEGLHHVALHNVMRRVKANLKNILVVGPAGSGKTTLAENLARSLGLAFATASCSGGMPEWYLTGRSLPDLTTGQSRYQISDFVRLYENGGVFLLDEIDAADPNVMVVINSALANGHMSVPARVENPTAKRHEKFYLLAAANTYGRGADMQYQGRNALDAATLDRFVGAVITVDYDRKLEERLVPEQEITLRVWEMRDRIMKLGIRRIMGTRALLSAASLFRSGETVRESLQALTVGWTPDEISKIATGIIPN